MNLSERLSSEWRRLSYSWSPKYRHTCLKCGFLSFDGDEAYAGIRRTVAAQGEAGWFAKENAVDCYKHLWNWADDAAVNIITFEANRARFRCAGFRRYLPGRSPEAHLKL